MRIALAIGHSASGSASCEYGSWIRGLHLQLGTQQVRVPHVNMAVG